VNFKIYHEIFQAVCYTAILILLIRSLMYRKNVTTIIMKRLNYLHNLINVIGAGQCSPVHRALYFEIAKRGVEDPMTDKEEQEFFKKFLYKMFNDNKNIVQERIKEINDPLHKDRIKKQLIEAEYIMTLIDTIDETTSKEQIEVIMTNIIDSEKKMRGYDQEDL